MVVAASNHKSFSANECIVVLDQGEWIRSPKPTFDKKRNQEPVIHIAYLVKKINETDCFVYFQCRDEGGDLVRLQYGI